MINQFSELSTEQRQTAKKLAYLEKRTRALSIYRLLAEARISVCKNILNTLQSKLSKKSKAKLSKAEKARRRRAQNLDARIQRSMQFVRAFENTSRRVLVRRVLTRIQLMEGVKYGHPNQET